MKKYEYKIKVFKVAFISEKNAMELMEEEMNKLGADGWELVTFSDLSNKAVFKRELSEYSL